MSTDSSRMFPIELLSQSAEDRVNYFHKQVFAHARFNEVLDEVKQTINAVEPGSLILLFGPTRIGKTTLKEILIKDLLTEALDLMKENPGWIPVAAMIATAHGRRPYDWKYHCIQGMKAFNEPMIKHKISDDEFNQANHKPNGNERKHISSKFGVPPLELRSAFEECLIQRRPKVFIIDEAPHMQRVSGSQGLRDQLDTAKSFAENTSTTHLLLGTYDLLPFINLSDQLGARSVEIHFSRYRRGIKTDEENFQRVLRNFEFIIPLPEPPRLVEKWEFFYEHSFGLLGVIKKWLARSLMAAVKANEKTLTEQILTKYAPPPDKLFEIFGAIKQEKTYLEKRKTKEEELRKVLEKDLQEAKEIEKISKRQAKKPKSKNKPFQQKPVRRPIGEANAE